MSALSIFRRDEKGVAAVEFALIAPLLFLLLLGTHEVTNAIIAYKKAQKVAYTIDNLVTKSSGLTKASTSDLLRTAASLMAPFDPSHVSIRLQYVQIDHEGVPSVAWSSLHNAEGSDSAPLIPEAYLSLTDVGFVSTKVIYEHHAVVTDLFFDTLALTAQSIVRPRLGRPLQCVDC